MSRSRKGSRKSGAARSGANLNGRTDRPLAVPDDNEIEDVPVTQVQQGTTVAPAKRRRFSRRRIILSVLAVFLVIILVGAGWVYFTVQKTLPTLSGTIQIKGLSAPVTVTRDTYGVPHIVAANVTDLYTAQGYVHAQDRLAQMFLFRAYGEGRVAELGGSDDAVLNDRFLRTIGFRRAAEVELAQMAPEVRAGLEAYARGVNEFIHTHEDSLPLEFTLGGFKIEDWQPLDSVTFAKLQAWDLTSSYDQDLLTADLTQQLGITRTAQLLPGFPNAGPFIVPGANSGTYLPLLQFYNDHIRPQLPDLGLKELGSNNWVVSGQKSATGAPLLSNDPHLALRNPSPWYQVHLSTTDGKYDVVGFGFASAPGVVTGHNQNIAWGVTNTEVDVQDTFIEKVDPVNHPNQYMVGDKWEPMQLITETINVKGGDPVTQTVRLTRHGPILNDASTITSTVGVSTTDTIAMQWTAAQPGHLLESVYALQTASNWQQFRAALSKWDVPGQNFVYADKQGNIGYQMTGNVPIRKKGDGSAPVPGWTGDYDWNGFIPFDDLPRAYNPPEGYIATANNRPYGPDYKNQIPGHWAPPWRIDRITQMITDTLKTKGKLGVDDFKTMLMDTKSPIAKKFGSIIATLKPTSDKEKQVVSMFTGWDGDLKADSVPATVYEFVIRNAISETFADDMGSSSLFGEYVVVGGNSTQRALENLLDVPNDPFWDTSVTTGTKELRDDILLKSLSSAVSDLSQGLGDNVADWQWGKIHTVSPPHPFAQAPVVGGVFSLPSLPIGGDGTTVSVAGFPLLRSFEVNHHQSYRMIIDVGDFTKSLGIFATGQSGQPFAKHWGDMLGPWQQFEYNPLLYTKEMIDAQKDAVLTLNP